MMLMKPLKNLSFLVLSAFLIASVLFGGFTRVDALVKGWTPPEEEALSEEANGNNPLGIVIVKSEENEGVEHKENSSKEVNMENSSDLFDDLIFPFEPGLGN